MEKQYTLSLSEISAIVGIYRSREWYCKAFNKSITPIPLTEVVEFVQTEFNSLPANPEKCP